MRSSEGWNEISRERKRELIDAIVSGKATRGPVHAELDLTDRCNVACYFCNQQDLRTKEQIPIKKATELIDELAEMGTKVVRLSGGGDPLFHREILDVLDHLGLRGLVVDNLTTNGVALGPEVAQRLVRDKAREVLFSLNAVDGADYHRMMQVKPALFDKVCENIRHLVAVRGDATHPGIVVQFLIDRVNWRRLIEMYELGRSLGVDRIAINAVLEIPRDRINHELLLLPEEADLARPLVREILMRDREAGVLQLDFAMHKWSEMLWEVRSEVGKEPANLFPTASSFKEENAGCFFAWYSAAVTGNGDLYPCCLLLNPDYKPLGNINESSFSEQWNGPAFQKMREEMREVLLAKGKLRYRPGRFQYIKRQCVEPGMCWLKNMYFRGDEEFYRELGEALEKKRSEEVRFIGTPRQMRRAWESVMLRSASSVRLYDVIRNTSRPARLWLKRRFGLRLTGAA